MSDTGTGSVSWTPVTSTLTIAAIQFVIFYYLFERWRGKDKHRPVFQARRSARPHRTPEEASPSWFKWPAALQAVDDDETLRCIGMDTYVLLRFLRFGFMLTFWTGLVAVIILIPVYATGNNTGSGTGGYNQITLAQVEQDGDRLWASLLFFVGFVAWTLFLLSREWKNFVPLRYNFLAEGDPDMDEEFSNAAIIENVPGNLRSSEGMRSWYDNLFPGQVSYASLVLNTGDLDKAVKERHKNLLGVEKAVALKKANPNKPPMHKKGGFLCLGGEKVDKEEFHREELTRLNEEVAEEHKKITDQLMEQQQRLDQIAAEEAEKAAAEEGEEKSEVKLLEGEGDSKPETEAEKEAAAVCSSTGFVVFRTATAKLAATQLNLAGKVDYMDTEAADPPKDMIWDNVPFPRLFQQANRVWVNGLWTTGILFWAIPVAFVQAVANLDSLAADLNFDPPDKDSFLYGLIAGLLPVVALAILMAILPIFIEMSAAKIIKMKSGSAVDRYTFVWHFGFQVANLWLSLIGGSIFNQLEPLLAEPASIVDIIANALPGASQFFLNIIITQTFGSLLMELSLLVPVVVNWLLTKIFKEESKTDRELRTAAQPKPIKWGIKLPPMIFNLMVALVYAPIVPIMLPFAAAFFGIAYVVWKNQALYVYAQTAEGGGQIWYPLFKMIMGCLYMSEVIFIAYMGIKEGKAQSPLAIVLLVVTIVWHAKIGRAVINPSKELCVLVARASDDESAKIPKEPKAKGVNQWDGKAYAQPNLIKEEWETEPEGYRTSELGTGKLEPVEEPEEPKGEADAVV